MLDQHYDAGNMGPYMAGEQMCYLEKFPFEV